MLFFNLNFITEILNNDDCSNSPALADGENIASAMSGMKVIEISVQQAIDIGVYFAVVVLIKIGAFEQKSPQGFSRDDPASV